MFALEATLETMVADGRLLSELTGRMTKGRTPDAHQRVQHHAIRAAAARPKSPRSTSSFFAFAFEAFSAFPIAMLSCLQNMLRRAQASQKLELFRGKKIMLLRGRLRLANISRGCGLYEDMQSVIQVSPTCKIT